MNLAHDMFQRAFKSSGTATLIADRNSDCVFVNQAFEDLTGYDAQQIARGGLQTLHGQETDPGSMMVLHSAMKAGRELRVVLRSYRADGSCFWNAVHLVPVFDQQGASTHYLALLQDVSGERSYSELLYRRAHQDPLTGLPNRLQLQDRIAQLIARERAHGSAFALGFVDVDHFKAFNDTFGHDRGDELLRLIGARLEHCVRETDTVCRYGGDEFVVLLPCVTTRFDATFAESRLRQAVLRPVVLDGQHLQVSCSVGVSLYPADGCDPDALLRRADQAMYRQKSIHRVPAGCTAH